MKKFLMLLTICILSVQIQAQVFDEPIDSTEHYNLRLYAQSARVPNTILNDDKVTMDSVIYSLIVWTDTLQYVTVLDTNVTSTHLTFKISNYATGSDSFVTTATTDTVTITGADTLMEAEDIFLIQPYGATISSNDVLSYTVLGDNQIVIRRPSSGTSGLEV